MSADAEEWDALMAASLQGDAIAYRRLLDALRLWLLRYYARRLPPPMVDDAVQETLIAIHAKRHTYDPARPFKPWLTAVARYKWIDRLRATARAAAEPLPEHVAVGDHEHAVTSAVLLDALLDRLKPAQGAAIRLVKLKGYSVEDASRLTGQSASLIKVNIHRGLAKLAAIVQRGDEAD